MTVRVVQTAYGRVLMPDTEAGYRFTQGSGVYEEHVYIERVCALVREVPRGIVVDCGANYGFWSLALAPLADQVVSVEPQRAIYNMLCGTVALNGLDYHVFPHRLAVGACPYTEEISILAYDRPGMFGGLSLGSEPHPGFEAPFEVVGREPVQVVRLDDCMDREQRVSFVKMDIEGGEAAALRGAQETVARWRPLMFVEAEHSRTDKEALRRQIRAMGYDVQDLKRNFLCVPR